MRFRELSIPDSYEITPKLYRDDRGVFAEWYRFDAFEEQVGRRFDLRQGNVSVSRARVLRGVHFSAIPRGQAKYVTAMHGAVLDFVVDVRVGSPTFGRWDSVLLDSDERKLVFLAEGLGHAFVALTDDATVSYLVSDVHRPDREFGIQPLDPEIGLELPGGSEGAVLSEKDAAAPTLAEAASAGILPTWEEAQALYRAMREGS